MSESELVMPGNAETLSQDDDNQVPLSPGAQLAAQRKIMGWSVEQVAAHLKLAPRQIYAIEENDYASLPGMASVRGFVRAYAKLVRIEGGPLIQLISSNKHEDIGNAPARRELSTPFAETPLPTMKRRSTSIKLWVWMSLIALALLVLLIQLMGWIPGALQANLFRIVNGTEVRLSAPVLSPKNIAKPLSVPSPIAPSPMGVDTVHTDVNGSGVEVNGVTMKASLTASTVSTLSTMLTTSTSTATTIIENNLLVLHFRQDSWVEAKRGDGVVMISRLIKAGATETVEVSQPVQLVVGKPDGVDATLRGVALELKPMAGSTTARLSLK